MKNIVGLMVALVVGVLMVGTLLAPTVSSMTPATLTYENEGSFFATPDDGNHIIVFSEEYATVDGVEVEYPVGFGTGNARNATVILGDNWMFRLDSNMLRLVIAGPENSFINMGAIASDITVTISGDSLTYTYNNVETTLDNLKYYLSSEGEMVLCYNPYVTEDSLIIGGIRNNNNTANADIFETVSGTVADGFTAEICRVLIYDATPQTGTVTTTDWEINTSEITTNLLQLDSINQDLKFWTDATATVTLTYLLAPSVVVYDNPNYIGSLAAPVLSAVIVVLIVAFVTVAARGINRD